MLSLFRILQHSLDLKHHIERDLSKGVVMERQEERSSEGGAAAEFVL